MPEEVDIILSEWMGYALLYVCPICAAILPVGRLTLQQESMFDSVVWARKNLGKKVCSLLYQSVFSSYVLSAVSSVDAPLRPAKCFPRMQPLSSPFLQTRRSTTEKSNFGRTYTVWTCLRSCTYSLTLTLPMAIEVSGRLCVPLSMKASQFFFVWLTVCQTARKEVCI